MHFFTELDTRMAAISGLLPVGMTVEMLGSVIQSLDDVQVEALAKSTAQAQQVLEQVMLATSAVVSARSSNSPMTC